MENLQDLYNLNLNDQDGNNQEGLYKLLIDYDIATQGEIDLVCAINGQNIESLLDIVYVKTGLRSIEQLLKDLS